MKNMKLREWNPSRFPEMAAMEQRVTFRRNNLPVAAFPIMEDIRRQGKLCDVTLKVDDHVFTAHRIVLASTIPYFRPMFTHEMAESSKREIKMHGIDPSALEALINYAYSTEIIIVESKVQALLVGASYLQMTEVRDACCDFLKTILDADNVIGIRQFADTLSCKSLVEAATKFIQMHFIEVAQSEEFLSLPLNEIKGIIGNDELHVTSEEQVFEAVMVWVKRHPMARKNDLSELLTKVRMPLLTPQYITDHVATEDLVRTSHGCRDLVDEARDYYLLPERRPLLQSFRTQPRCCNSIVGMIYAVGGLTKSGDSLSTVEVFDPILNRWQIAEAMTMLRSRVGVVVMKNKMYAIGGYNGQDRLRTVEVFDPESKRWSKVASMNFQRSAAGAAVLNDRLYVCGGYDGVSSLNTVECYNPDKNEWTLVSNMSKHRSAAGVVAFNGHIYSLGGHDGLSIFDSVERYDPSTSLWSPVTPMLSKRCRLGVATLNGKLYVCGGYDGAAFLRTVEVFDPAVARWTRIAPMNVTRSRVALVSNCGKLFAIGGYDGVSNLNTVETYNPESNQWSFAASMCAHEGGVGVGVIPLS